MYHPQNTIVSSTTSRSFLPLPPLPFLPSLSSASYQDSDLQVLTKRQNRYHGDVSKHRSNAAHLSGCNYHSLLYYLRFARLERMLIIEINTPGRRTAPPPAIARKTCKLIKMQVAADTVYRAGRPARLEPERDRERLILKPQRGLDWVPPSERVSGLFESGMEC